METEQIKKYLHQRSPYLMVSKVIELDKKTIYTKKSHSGQEPHIKGHFPGMPVIPGAMIQEFCTQSAGILITKYYSPVDNYDSSKTKGHALGVLNKIEYAKFLTIAKPQYDLFAKVELIDHFENLFKFEARVMQKETLVSKIRFNLVNLKDTILEGSL